VAAGLLIAFSQLGAAVATPLFTRKAGPAARLRWMGPMAVLTCAVLLAAALRPGLVPSMALFTVSNTFAAYQVAANTAFVEHLPKRQRGLAFGLANAGLVVGQGASFAIAGAIAGVVPPPVVVAAGAGLGTLSACGLALSWRRISAAASREAASGAAAGRGSGQPAAAQDRVEGRA
jgi:MFS family permease